MAQVTHRAFFNTFRSPALCVCGGPLEGYFRQGLQCLGAYAYCAVTDGERFVVLPNNSTSRLVACGNLLQALECKDKMSSRKAWFMKHRVSNCEQNAAKTSTPIASSHIPIADSLSQAGSPWLQCVVDTRKHKTAGFSRSPCCRDLIGRYLCRMRRQPSHTIPLRRPPPSQPMTALRAASRYAHRTSATMRSHTCTSVLRAFDWQS
jgi:hypothetical protein